MSKDYFKLVEILNRVKLQEQRDIFIYGQSKPTEEYFTVEDWMYFDAIPTEEQQLKYPAAKKVATLKNSKLYKALK